MTKDFTAEFTTNQTLSAGFRTSETEANLGLDVDIKAPITEEREIEAEFSSTNEDLESVYNDGGEIPISIEEPVEMTADFGQIFRSGGSATSYNELLDKPQINGVTVVGIKTGEDYGLQDLMEPITNAEIDEITEA